MLLDKRTPPGAAVRHLQAARLVGIPQQLCQPAAAAAQSLCNLSVKQAFAVERESALRHFCRRPRLTINNCNVCAFVIDCRRHADQVVYNVF